MLLTTVFFNFGRKKVKIQVSKVTIFFTISGPFFANYISIFHKTEILTVILRCLTGLTYDWLKSYDTKRKYFHFFFFCDFVQKQIFASFMFFTFLCFLS